MAVSLDLTDIAAREAHGASARAALAEMPTLIGLTRSQLADALQEAGVPERQVRMRVAPGGGRLHERDGAPEWLQFPQPVIQRLPALVKTTRGLV